MIDPLDRWREHGEKPDYAGLLTYGGHGFEEKQFFALWDALPGIRYTKAQLPQSADLLQPGLEKQYDVIVMYDMAKGFTPRQEQNFLALVQKGMVIDNAWFRAGVFIRMTEPAGVRQLQTDD